MQLCGKTANSGWGGVKYYELKSTAPEESIIIEQLDIKAFQYGKIVSIHFNTSGKILKPSTWIEIATLPKELTPAYPVILNYPIQTLGNIMLLHITSEQAIRIFMSSGEAMTDSRRIIGQHVMYIAKY